MSDKFSQFAALHVPGSPVILYNIWDVGSAKAVETAGAKALATGSHPVADAAGWADGQGVPIDFGGALDEQRHAGTGAFGNFDQPPRVRRVRRPDDEE